MDLKPDNTDMDQTLKTAFSYWRRTLVYQLIFTVTYFSLFFIVWYSLAMRFGILDDLLLIFSKGSNNVKNMQESLQKLTKIPEYYNFSLGLLIGMAFLYPMNVGFFQLYRKLDLKQEISISDLFSGYNGANFFKFSSYFLFWIFVYQYSMITIVLGVVWVLVTVFVSPLMFFRNIGIFEGIQQNFRALKKHFIKIFVCVLVAIIFRYAGALIFFVGILFTYPFWNALIYTLYQDIFAEKEKDASYL